MIISYHDENMLNSAVRMLSSGGIIIMPCDTIYGFIGRYPDADARIRAVKGRKETKPFLVLARPDQLSGIAGQEIPEDLKKYWPGPLTLILKDSSGRKTVAVRVPNDPLLQCMMGEVGTPFFSTSVNRSTSPPLNRIDQIIAEFEADVDLIIDGGNLEGGSPSTIVDATSRPYRLVRQGSLIPEL